MIEAKKEKLEEYYFFDTLKHQFPRPVLKEDQDLPGGVTLGEQPSVPFWKNIHQILQLVDVSNRTGCEISLVFKQITIWRKWILSSVEAFQLVDVGEKSALR